MRVAGTKAKFHAGAEIGGRPMRITVVGNRRDSGPQRTIDIGRPGPDMADVEMGGDIGEARPYLTAVEIAIAGLQAPRRRRDRGNQSFSDLDVNQDQAFGVYDEIRRGVGHKRCWSACVSKDA